MSAKKQHGSSRLCLRSPDRTAALVDLCVRVTEAASVVRRQAEAGEFDTTLVPADVLARLDDRLCSDPDVTAAGLVSRALTFWFRNLCNVESIPADLARLLLAG